MTQLTIQELCSAQGAAVNQRIDAEASIYTFLTGRTAQTGQKRFAASSTLHCMNELLQSQKVGTAQQNLATGTGPDYVELYSATRVVANGWECGAGTLFRLVAVRGTNLLGCLSLLRRAPPPTHYPCHIQVEGHQRLAPSHWN